MAALLWLLEHKTCHILAAERLRLMTINAANTLKCIVATHHEPSKLLTKKNLEFI